MGAYVFVTKEELQAERRSTRKDPRWTCSSTTQTGDSLLVYIVGVGVRFEWRATSDAKRGDFWPYVCELKFVRSFKPPITIQELRAAVPRTDWSPPHQNFRGFKSISVPAHVLARIKSLRSKGSRSLLAIQIEFEKKVEQSMALSSEQRRKRLLSASPKPKQIQIATTVFLRNCDVVADVRRRAKGMCEICHSKAPFRRASDGSPYLEVHHRVRLADGGDDTVDNAVATCPNCHRRAHFG
jgi:hypothetical protein